MAKEKINIVLQGVNNTQKAFNQIKHNLSVLDRKTKLLQKGFSTVAKASAVAFTAIGVAVGASTAKIDRLVKTSEKLGVGVEFLQKFRFAAEQVGIRTETADMALQRFSRRVAEARKGTGEAKDTLTQLGIALFDSAGNSRDIEDVMLDVANAMGQTKDASELVRQSFKFFDSEGVALVALMKNGSEAMQEFFTDAENLGAVLTQESAKGVANFADEFTKLKTGIGGVINQFTAGLAPVLTQITKDFTAFVIQLNKDVDKLGFKTLGDFLANEFLNILKGIIKAFEFLGNELIAIANIARDIGMSLGFVEESEAVKQIRQQLQEINTLEETNNRFKTNGERLSKDMVLSRGAEKQLLLDQLALELEKGKFQKLNFDKTLKFIDQIRSEINKDPITITGDNVDSEEEPRFVRTMRLAIENFNKETVEGLMVKSFENAFQSAEDALVDFVQTGKLNFKDLVDSLIADMARIQIREKFIQPMLAGFESSSSSGKGFFSSFLDGLGAFFGVSAQGGGFTGMGARAGGIDGKGGFPAILHPNETVIDHQQGQSGGIVINQSLNFATGVQDTVKNEVLQMLPDIAETSKSAVLEAMQRGGNFRKAMR